MVITTDLNIFADKYHNKQHLPDDLINIIMNINTDIIKREKIKQQHKNKFKWVVSRIDTLNDICLNNHDFLNGENSIYRKSCMILNYINYGRSSAWSSDSEDEDSEDEDDYEENDDWDYAYGFSIEDGKYTIVIAAGGSHWENYVIQKDGVYLENTHGKSKINGILVSAEGSYLSVKPTDYELKDEESDMYEMIQEYYEEEIMNYFDEDEYDSDSD